MTPAVDFQSEADSSKSTPSRSAGPARYRPSDDSSRSSPASTELTSRTYRYRPSRPTTMARSSKDNPFAPKPPGPVTITDAGPFGESTRLGCNGIGTRIRDGTDPTEFGAGLH